jgi:hypothetical protein
MIYIHATTNEFFQNLARAIQVAIPGPSEIFNIIPTNKNEKNDLWIVNWMTYIGERNFRNYVPNYIVYQTEKISYKLKMNPGFRDVLDAAVAVYDYSPKNIDVYSKAQYVPLLYSPAWDRKKYDVLFYGSMTERRKQICQELRDAGLICHVNEGMAQQAYIDDMIDKSKIVLSCHHNEVKNNDSARIMPLISNGVVVVAEASIEPEFDKYIEPYCHVVPRDKIVEKCVSLIYKDPFVFPIPERFRTW